MEERWKLGVKLFRQWKDYLLVDTDHSKTIPAFISHCLLPRCILTPEDAMYCAAFIRRMTLEDTPYFSFMLCAQLVRPARLKRELLLSMPHSVVCAVRHPGWSVWLLSPACH